MPAPDITPNTSIIDDPRVIPDGEAQRSFSVKSPRAWLYRDRINPNSADTELLYGHHFIMHKTVDGWMYGQAKSPVPEDAASGYVGWMHRDDLQDMETPTHRVISLKAPIFESANIKSRVVMALPFGALVQHQAARPKSDADDNFIEVLEGYIHRKHLALHGQDYGDDFAAIAQRHLGLPYIWAGISSDGLDCSGLVQTSLRAAGRDVPRDADMQEAALGKDVTDPYRRGDLIFWAGHVGIMVSPDTMIHANAHHMMVAAEPLSSAIARIGTVRTAKRLDIR